MARPKPTTETRTDCHGEYLVYTNRVCLRCSVELTSRNKTPERNTCRPCQQKIQLGKNNARPAKVVHKTAKATPAVEKVVNHPPHVRALQSAFSSWMRYPDAAYNRDALDQAMKSYELRYLLDRVCPSPPPLAF